jgi:hypothetical protein
VECAFAAWLGEHSLDVGTAAWRFSVVPFSSAFARALVNGFQQVPERVAVGSGDDYGNNKKLSLGVLARFVNVTVELLHKKSSARSGGGKLLNKPL